MRYISIEEARKTLGSLDQEEVAVTKRGKIAFYTIPTAEIAEFRLFQRKRRLEDSARRVEAMKAGQVEKLGFEDLP
ncbi:MAG: hypothetical protein RRB13_01130 [bacterium]|nr:hypothetical protein [bacterium]